MQNDLIDEALGKNMIEKALATLKNLNEKGAELEALARSQAIAIIPMPGAPGGFVPPGLAGPTGKCPNQKIGAIFWDPFRDTMIYAKKSVSATNFYEERLPPWLVLGHELGHFLQYGRNPTQFTRLALKGSRELDWTTRNLNYAGNIKENEHPLCKDGGFGLRFWYMPNRDELKRSHSLNLQRVIRSAYVGSEVVVGWDGTALTKRQKKLPTEPVWTSLDTLQLASKEISWTKYYMKAFKAYRKLEKQRGVYPSFVTQLKCSLTGDDFPTLT
jgi:hypothetical protein